VGKAWDEVLASFDRFRLGAGIGALGAMMEKDAKEACGARHARSEGRGPPLGRQRSLRKPQQSAEQLRRGCAAPVIGRIGRRSSVKFSGLLVSPRKQNDTDPFCLFEFK
jgi:hypothetical protein